MSKLKTTLRIGLGVGVATSTLLSLITDFYIPVAPYGIYLGFTGFLILLISLALYFIPFCDRRLSMVMGDVWYLPVFLLLIIFSASMFFSYYLGKNTEGGNGYLASNFEEISQLQSEMLVVAKKIESNTKATAKNTGRTADNTEALKNIVKKEVSDDPKKELANLGLTWTQESFYEAINSDNADAVNLFLSTGMVLNYYDFYNYNLSNLIANPTSHKQLLKVLKEKKVDKVMINQVSNLLGLAGINPQLDKRVNSIIKEKLKNKVDLSVNLQAPPILMAILMGNAELVSTLLKLGASTSPYCGSFRWGDDIDDCLFEIDIESQAKIHNLSLDN